MSNLGDPNPLALLGPLEDEVIELRLMRVLGPADSDARPATERFLSRDPEYRLAIHRRSDGVRVGRVALRLTQDPEIIGALGHLGYWVEEPYRRNGYALRAIGLSIALLRARGIKPLWILIEPENIASRRAIERVGFRFVDVVDTWSELVALGRGPKICRYVME